MYNPELRTANIETHVNGLGDIYCCSNENFDAAVDAVSTKSAEVISGRDLVYGRIQDATAKDGWKNSALCKNTSYIREGSLFVPKSANKKSCFQNL